MSSQMLQLGLVLSMQGLQAHCDAGRVQQAAEEPGGCIGGSRAALQRPFHH